MGRIAKTMGIGAIIAGSLIASYVVSSLFQNQGCLPSPIRQIQKNVTEYFNLPTLENRLKVSFKSYESFKKVAKDKDYSPPSFEKSYETNSPRFILSNDFRPTNPTIYAGENNHPVIIMDDDLANFYINKYRKGS